MASTFPPASTSLSCILLLSSIVLCSTLLISDEGVVESIIREVPSTHRISVSNTAHSGANFSTIADALNYTMIFAKQNDTARFIVFVHEGVYRENVGVTRNNITLIGEGINRTIITFGKHVETTTSTFNSSTFAVDATDFTAIGISFINSAGPQNHQAVAVRASAEHAAFFQCSFHGYQDTLYVHTGTQFFRDCEIYGTVDFIFGDAAVVFQNCNIYAQRPLLGQGITITAQGRDCKKWFRTGITLQGCSIMATSELKPWLNATRTYLGRPWNICSATVVMQSRLDELVDPSGWLDWDGRGNLSTIFYGEYHNSGKGANTDARVPWPGCHRSMTMTEAMQFTPQKFIGADLWLPHTKIPYVSGLLTIALFWS